LPNKFVFKEALVTYCNYIRLACFKVIIIIYDAEYQLFLSNLVDLCRTVVKSWVS